MQKLLLLALLYLADSCLGYHGGGYYGNHLPGPYGYVAPVEGECGCCPPPCCCTCVETGVPIRTTTTTTTTTTAEIICDFKMDLAFLLDSSGSIGYNDWLVALQFVVDVTATFGNDIGNQGTLVGMVTYSNNATVEWDFTGSETQNAAALEVGILGLQLMGGFTNTVEGLEKVNTQVFNTNGDRDWPTNSKAVPNVLVVMTDGRANFRESELPQKAADMKQTATVIVIGVTTEINMTELELIASSPDLVFTVEDYNSLSSILNDIKLAVCPTIVIPTLPPPPPPPMKPKKECFCCCPPPPGYPEIGYDHGHVDHGHVHYSRPYGCKC